LKKSSGIIVSMLEQPNSELMNQYGIKAAFFLTQVNKQARKIGRMGGSK